MRESEYTSLEETNVRPAQERWSMIVYLLDFRPYSLHESTNKRDEKKIKIRTATSASRVRCLRSTRAQNQTTMSTAIKGLAKSDVQYDGSSLRVAIVHARWNKTVIDALVAGAVAKLKERGVKDSNIVIQSVPGSFELPLACSKYIFIQNFNHKI